MPRITRARLARVTERCALGDIACQRATVRAGRTWYTSAAGVVEYRPEYQV